MTLDQQRLADFLSHIIEAIDRIEHYTAGLDEQAFLATPLVQDAVIRNLEIVGEASHGIERHAPEFAAAHPELPLSFAYQMRNAIAHGYSKVDLQVVWRTIKVDLPPLRQNVQRARSRSDPG
ncbi:MAG: DUF86 domain-containing protein [Rubrivivax sp.]|nr:DUF86 domain-containing protein [Rubrivivax sp.]